MRLSRKPIYIIFLLVVMGGLFFVWRLGLFNISKIDVTTKDLRCASEKELKESSALLGQNFFLIDFSKTESILKKKFACIKSVALSKKLPNFIKLEALPRQPFAQLVTADVQNIATPSAGEIKGSYIIDDEGVELDSVANEAGIPKVYIPDIDISKPNLLKILLKVKTFNLDVPEAFVIDDYLILSGRPQIIFRLGSKIDTQLASLQLILNEAKIDLSNLEFIDLRFDKPIVKLAPKKNGER
ncbi:hypothetical protein KKE03_04055 [Patescibacteria group bacterium]|nr:hypothetical protein [Patescibacteria group bacterium]